MIGIGIGVNASVQKTEKKLVPPNTETFEGTEVINWSKELHKEQQ